MKGNVSDPLLDFLDDHEIRHNRIVCLLKKKKHAEALVLLNIECEDVKELVHARGTKTQPIIKDGLMSVRPTTRFVSEIDRSRGRILRGQWYKLHGENELAIQDWRWVLQHGKEPFLLEEAMTFLHPTTN